MAQKQNSNIYSTANSNDDLTALSSVTPNLNEFGTTLLDRAFVCAREGLFGVLYIMAKNTKQSTWISSARFFADFLQVLIFTFSERAAFAWNPATKVLLLSQYVRIDLLKLFDDPAANDLFWLIFATVTVVLTLSNAFYVAASFSRGQIRRLWPLRILRSTATIIVTLGYIPLASVFLKTIRCDKHNRSLSLGLDCGCNTHIIVVVLASILSILLFVFSSIVTVCFFNSTPSRVNVLGRPHARAEFVYLFARTVLSVTFSIVEVDNTMNHTALGALLLLCSFTTTGAYLFFAPYYKLYFVKLRVALCAIWAWTNVGLMLSILIDRPDDSGIVIMTAISTPLAATLAVLAVRARRLSLCRTPTDCLRSPYEVELKARWTLEDHSLLFDEDVIEFISSGYRHQVKSIVERDEVLAGVRNIYERGLQRFRSSSILRLFAAYFYNHTLHNQQLWSKALVNVESRSPSLDETFNIFRQRKIVADTNARSSSDVLSLLELEHTLVAARSAIRQSLLAQLCFWSELVQRVPNLSKLQSISYNISKHAQIAGTKCKRLLRLERDNSSVLRVYAAFLMYVVNEHTEGLRLIERAKANEKVATQKLSDDALNSSTRLSLDQSRNALAILTIDKQSSIITSSNAVMSKIVGMTIRECKGMHINDFLPDVVSKTHHHIMNKFYNGDQGSEIVDKEHSFFIKHKNGYIIHILAKIRSASFGNDDTDVIMTFRVNEQAMQIGQHSAIVEIPNGVVHACTQGLPALCMLTSSTSTTSYSGFNFFECIPTLRGQSGEKLFDTTTGGIGLDSALICKVGHQPAKVYSRQLLTQACWLVILVEIIDKDTNKTNKQMKRSNSLRSSPSMNTRFRMLSPSSKSHSIMGIGSTDIGKRKSSMRNANISNNIGSSACSSIPTLLPSLDTEEKQVNAATVYGGDDFLAHEMRQKIRSDNTKVERGVVVLGSALCVSLACILYLSIGNVMIMNNTIQNYVQALENVRGITYQKKDIVSISYITRRLIGKSDFDSTGNTTALASREKRRILKAKYEWLRQKLALMVDRVENDHLLRYNSESKVDVPTAKVFTHRYAMLSELDFDCVSTHSHRLSYFDAIQSMLISARAVLSEMIYLNMALNSSRLYSTDNSSHNLTMTEKEVESHQRQLLRNVHAVVVNGPRIIEYLLSEITDLYEDDARQTVDDLDQWKSMYLILSFAFIIGLIVLVFMPTIWKVQRNQDEVLAYFFDLPTDVLEDMQKLCRDSLKDSAIAASEDEDGEQNNEPKQGNLSLGTRHVSTAKSFTKLNKVTSRTITSTITQPATNVFFLNKSSKQNRNFFTHESIGNCINSMRRKISHFFMSCRTTLSAAKYKSSTVRPCSGAIHDQLKTSQKATGQIVVNHSNIGANIHAFQSSTAASDFNKIAKPITANVDGKYSRTFAGTGQSKHDLTEPWVSSDRTFRKSACQQAKLTIQVVMLLLVFSIFVVSNHLRDIEEVHQDSNASVDIAISTRLHFHAEAVLGRAIESLSLSNQSSEREHWSDASERSLNYLEQAQHALVYGGILNLTKIEGSLNGEDRPLHVLTGSAKRFALRDDFLFNDACKSLTLDSERAECYAFQIVDFGSGFQVAFSEFLSHIHRVVIRVKQGNMSLQELYNDPSYVALESMLAAPMRIALNKASQLYFDEVYERTTSNKLSRNIEFVFLLLGLGFTVAFNYIPIMLRIDREVKRTRSMLLLLPDTVLTDVPSIRRLIKT